MMDNKRYNRDYSNNKRETIEQIRFSPSKSVSTRIHREKPIREGQASPEKKVWMILLSFFVFYGIVLGFLLFPYIGAFGTPINWPLTLLIALGISAFPFLFFVIIPNALRKREEKKKKIHTFYF